VDGIYVIMVVVVVGLGCVGRGDVIDSESAVVTLKLTCLVSV